jgi:hypothetical protein
MIDLFVNNPLLLLALLACCNPPGLITGGLLYWLGRNYKIRNPLVKEINGAIHPGQHEMDIMDI